MTKTAKAPTYKQAVGMIRAKLVTEYQSLSHCALALNPITPPGEPEPPITPEILRARRQVNLACEAISDAINHLNPLLDRPVEGEIYSNRDNAASEPGQPPYIVEGADHEHVSQYELQRERLEARELDEGLQPITDAKRDALAKDCDHGRRQQLFADFVLGTMTEHADWDADTTMQIASRAVELGLAVTDSNGHFQEVQPGQKVFDVYVTLHDTIVSDSEEEALDAALNMLNDREGMEIMKHEIIEQNWRERE